LNLQMRVKTGKFFVVTQPYNKVEDVCPQQLHLVDVQKGLVDPFRTLLLLNLLTYPICV